MNKKAIDTEYVFSDKDFTNWLAADSDFGFEMKTWEYLNKNIPEALLVQHGSSYVDPITSKHRENDIRIFCEYSEGSVHKLTASVECKNVSSFKPVVLLQRHRTVNECNLFGIGNHDQNFLSSFKGFYLEDDYVAKQVSQVFYNGQGEFREDRESIFEKWSQALSSLHPLVQSEFLDRKKIPQDRYTVFLPCVVVPDGALWTCNFNKDGSLSSCQQAERASYFVLNRYHYLENWQIYVCSHVEFLTFTGLTKLVDWMKEPTKHFGNKIDIKW